MAKYVVKKDGTKEAFDASKIQKSIESAAQEAGLAPDRVGQIVSLVSTTIMQLASLKDEVATSELKTNIFLELNKIEPAVVAAWEKYDEEQGKA